MKKGSDVQEENQRPAAYILSQVGLSRENGQLLHHKAHGQVQEKVIEDEAAKYFDDILTGKKPGKEMADCET